MPALNRVGFAPAGLVRRLLSLLYEALLLGGVLAFAAMPYVILTRGVEHVIARPLLQFYLVLLAGVYFVWQWRRGGQTLPMKTWHVRLVARDAVFSTGSAAVLLRARWIARARRRLRMGDRRPGAPVPA